MIKFVRDDFWCLQMRKALIRDPPKVSRGKSSTLPLMIRNTDRARAWWSVREQKTLNSASLVASLSWCQRPGWSLWDNRVSPVAPVESET